jgi:hypothetical protein
MQSQYFKADKWLRGFVDCKDNLFPERTSDVALIVGTSGTMEYDLRRFDSFGIDADVFAVNKAIALLDRKIDHFVSIDINSFLDYEDLLSEVKVHTINEKHHHFDFVDYYWNFDSRLLRMSGLFAAAIAVAMGYKKIIMAGAGMDTTGHADGTCMNTNYYPGRWKAPHAQAFIKHCGKNIRSFSGLTMDSFGIPTKEFVLSGDN